jgi:hypothetical protein
MSVACGRQEDAMRKPVLLCWVRGVALVAALACVVPMSRVHAGSEEERYSGVAVNMGAPVRWSTLSVQMVVDRWSTDGERDRLITVLAEQGPDGLLQALQRIPRVGYIRTPDSLGYDLHFARKSPGEDGGERVVLVTDRYITFWEATNRPRTVDYPFTVVELRIRPDGEGEGKMSLFTKISLDERTRSITLEDFGTQPVLLQSVRKH